ncbi:MAG: hypothetical protein ACRDJ1_07125 [Actinomycetota bacterium]
MRKAIVVSTLLLLIACGDDAILPFGGPVDVGFRRISERQNASLCVEGPQFALALSAAQWQAVWDRQNACQPGSTDALPPLLATEAGLVAWWKVEGCLGHTIKTTRITVKGTVITVKAESATPPAEFCASAIGGLESFLAIDIQAVRRAERLVFVLDGVEVGSLAVAS